MTLNDYFQLTGFLLYPGQSEEYRGQCVQSVMIKIKDVDGIEPPVYPDAKDYWFNGIPGYSIVANPQPGDIAVYNGHDFFPEGHIAVVSDSNGQVFEQNADPDGSPMHFYNRATTYLLGYLRYNGGNMAFDYNSIPSDADKTTYYQAKLGRIPTLAELADKQPWGYVNGTVANELYINNSALQQQVSNPPGFTVVPQLYTKD